MRRPHAITVTLGNPPETDFDERRLRALRAKEVLNGAGWLFDEHISDLTRELLSTAPTSVDATKREELFYQIDAAAQLKGRLLQIIQLHEAEAKAHERKERRRQSDAE